MKKILWGIIGVLVLANIFTIVAWRSSQADSAPLREARESQEQHPLLAKRLFTENPNDVIVNFTPLRNSLNQYFQQNLTTKNSFYFEYLPSGTSIRINSGEELVGASLLKLPIVMDLYRAHELGRVNIDQLITLKQEWLDNNYGKLYQRGAGAELTLREAAELVLHDSDNTAVRAIFATVDPTLKADEHALVQLDVPYSMESQADNVIIGAHSYSSLLKCLYMSCYTNQEHSQEMLQILAQAPSLDRLGSMLPITVPFAHKIGTFAQITQSDCGIAYVPKRNYVICMLVNLPEEDAKQHFRAVSKLVYEYVSKQ